MEINWTGILEEKAIGDRELTDAEMVMFRLLNKNGSAESAEIIEAVDKTPAPITSRAVRMMIRRWQDRGYLDRVSNTRRIRVQLAIELPEVPWNNGHRNGSDPIVERTGQLITSIDRLINVMLSNAGALPGYRDVQAERILFAYHQCANGSDRPWVAAAELRKMADLKERTARDWNDLLRAYGRTGMLELQDSNGLRVRRLEVVA